VKVVRVVEGSRLTNRSFYAGFKAIISEEPLNTSMTLDKAENLKEVEGPSILIY
jgi:hypothetical protein